MGILQYFQDKIHGRMDWPPEPVREHWRMVDEDLRRFENDAAEMLMHDTRMNSSEHRAGTYTPIPIGREIARYSASLLFSEPPKITHDTKTTLLEEFLEVNGLPPFLQSSAESVAAVGRGGLRVIWDEDVAHMPYLTFVPENNIIWNIKHGRAVLGGAVVIERVDPGLSNVWRLIEEHGVEGNRDEGGGYVRRKLYRGTYSYLGNAVELGSHPDFADLQEEEWTGLNVPTLHMWENVPGSHSDLAGARVLLDRLNEAESLLLDKARRSAPITFADRELADEEGEIPLEGVVFTGSDNKEMAMGESLIKTIETSQPAIQSEEHIQWIDHLREMILTHTGYSQASYGFGEEGRSDSGTALKLRQSRTLLTRAGKERMAREAIINAIATALAWAEGKSEIKEYRPEIRFSEGLPDDSTERANEIATRRQAQVVSLYQSILEQHPDWDEQAILEEQARIEGEIEAAKPPPPVIQTPEQAEDEDADVEDEGEVSNGTP